MAFTIYLIFFPPFLLPLQRFFLILQNKFRLYEDIIIVKNVKMKNDFLNTHTDIFWKKYNYTSVSDSRYRKCRKNLAV